MHRLLLLIALPLAGFAQPAPTTTGPKLVWSDEFNYEGLPDPARWNYEEGMVRNEEAQFYTRARKENCRVEAGCLVIEGRKEQFKNPQYQAGSTHWAKRSEFAGYTSASLTTRDRASWRSGRIEVRAKLPQGRGVWPAIWTLGTNIPVVGWPRCGEIDIMEYVGKDPELVHANAHYFAGGKHRSKMGSRRVPPPFADFHVYAIEWREDRIDYFFDGTRFHSFPINDAGPGGDNAFRKPHYLLLNLALGGNWGGPIDDANLPQKYLVDYVRVYELEPAASPSDGREPPVGK
jgi:beta-glucanase (GH16 family)